MQLNSVALNQGAALGPNASINNRLSGSKPAADSQQHTETTKTRVTFSNEDVKITTVAIDKTTGEMIRKIPTGIKDMCVIIKVARGLIFNGIT